MIQSNSKITYDHTAWGLVMSVIGIQASAPVAFTCSEIKTAWDNNLLSHSEDIYSRITLTYDNEGLVLSLAKKCPKARIVCILNSRGSPSATEMELKFRDNPLFKNIYVILHLSYKLNPESSPHLLEHLQCTGGWKMRKQGSITSQLLSKCRNLREIDVSFTQLNLYSVRSATEYQNSKLHNPPPILTPAKFTLPHLRTIKFRNCLICNYSMKRLLKGTRGLTRFEATGISDTAGRPSSLTHQLKPLLNNKQLTALSLRTRPIDGFILSTEILEGLKGLQLRELRLFGCHHGGHSLPDGDYGSGDAGDYDTDAHNTDTRWKDVFDSDTGDSELEEEEEEEEEEEKEEEENLNKINPKKKRTKLKSSKRCKFDDKRRKVGKEDNLISLQAQFIYSQRHTLTILELGYLLGTNFFLKALQSVHKASSSSSSIFPHVTHLSVTIEPVYDHDCCVMTQEGMLLLADIFPSVEDLRLSGSLSQKLIDGIITNPFTCLKVLRICSDDWDPKPTKEKGYFDSLKPTYPNLQRFIVEIESFNFSQYDEIAVFTHEKPHDQP